MYYRLADPGESSWRAVLELILAEVRSSALLQEDLEGLKVPVRCNGGNNAPQSKPEPPRLIVEE